MSKDLILRRYLRETTPMLGVLILLAVIAGLACYYVEAHWSVYAVIGVVLVANAAVYADYIRKIFVGSFGSTRFEREALHKWFGNHGGTRIDGMHLPG